jgi:hypothetical protein
MEIETIDDAIGSSGIKLCVFGLAGAGKTVLSATTGTNTVILSAEAGLLSLKNAPAEVKARLAVIQIKNLSDMGEAFNWLTSERKADWLVIDSISEIAEVVLSTAKEGTKDARGAYGDMADDMMKLIRALRDIPGYNVMMTSKMGRIKDEHTGITSYVPMLPGKQLTNQIPYMFDEIFALRVEPHPENPTEYVRVLQTGRDLMYDCKDRSGMLNLFEPADISYIANKIQGVPPAEVIQPATPETPAPEIPGAEPNLQTEEN